MKGYTRRDLLRIGGMVGLSMAAGPILSACSTGTTPTTPTSTQPQAPKTEKVRMACWSPPISEVTNLFAAEEFGWFKEQSLEFEFVPGAGSGDALKHVLAGNADLAFTSCEATLFAMDQGSKLKGIYNIYPQNAFNLVTKKSSGITNVSQLKGKKVGVYSLASGTRYNLMVMLKTVGLSEKDVEVIPVGVLNFAPFIEGKLDAMAATDTGLYAAEQGGLKDINVIHAKDFLNTPTDIFVVTEEAYKTKQDLLVRFLKAYKKGTQWMIDNEQKAAELAVKRATDGKDVARNLGIIKLRNLTTVSPDTKAQGLGWFSISTLQQVLDNFHSLEIVKNKYDATQIFTNELVMKL